MKRFWKQAEASGTQVLLDGKPLRIPESGVLTLPTTALAEAVAAEWDAVEGEIVRERLLLTQLATTAAQRIAPEPGRTVAALAAYAANDLLCYRAEAPPALVAAQDGAWQSWLDWAAERFAARLVVQRGLMPVSQPGAALESFRSELAALDAVTLAALGVLVPAYGSLVLGLAVAEGAIEAGAAYDLSTLDERFQESVWGEDREAIARRRAIRDDVAAAARFLALARL